MERVDSPFPYRISTLMELHDTIELLKIGWNQLVESGQMLDVEIQVISPGRPDSEREAEASAPPDPGANDIDAVAFDVYQKFEDGEITQTFQDPEKNGREMMGIKNLTVEEILPAIGQVVNQSLEKWVEAEIEFEPQGLTSGKTIGRFRRHTTAAAWEYFRTDYRLYFACNGIQTLLEAKEMSSWKRLIINLMPPNQIRMKFGEN